MPIREVGRSGERKNPRRRRKKKKARAGRLGAGLKHHLDIIDLGTVLGAKLYGAKVSAKSPSRLHRVRDLGVKIYGAELTTETCKLGATNDDAELRVQILKSYL